MVRSATRGAVAAGHEATVEAALAMLRQGGNAIDAAIAGAFASLVAEPVLAGLFGGGLMIVRHPDGRAQVLDFFARVPGLGAPAGSGRELDFRSVHIDFGPALQEFHIGRGSAAVPGTWRGLFEAHRRWGSLPIEALVEPARELARAGVALSPQMAFIFKLLEPILVSTPETRALFAPGGRLLEEGELHRNSDLGDVLGRLAREGLDGATGRAVTRAMLDVFGAEPGGGETGLLTPRDLAQAEPVVREPASVGYRGAAVLLPPPPTMGGPLIALGLEMLARVPTPLPVEADFVPWMARVHRLMSDARQERPDDFLAPDAVDARAQALLRAVGPGSTTHVSVIDAAGTAAGVTHSNGEGCGVVVPGTGAMMNNFLGEEDINPNGFHQQAPGEPILTMMCPTLLLDHGAVSVLGSGGSNRIRTAILQVIHNLVDRDMAVREAVDAPRMHVEGDIVNLETHNQPPAVVEAARTLGRLVAFESNNMFFGGVHIVRRGPGGFSGAGDVRRGGIYREL